MLEVENPYILHLTNLMTSFIKEQIGKDMGTSLANLKAVLEKQ